jgi:hypothetical protein
MRNRLEEPATSHNGLGAKHKIRYLTLKHEIYLPRVTKPKLVHVTAPRG